MKCTVVETHPPAKLNLYLELLGKRADGYHDLETVMIAIGHRDRLRVTRTEHSSISLECRWSPSVAVWRQRLPSAAPDTFSLPPAAQNLVTRALERFRSAFGVGGGFRVELDKRIPAGAGMGGASSDAASALLAAAALCGVEPNDPRLLEIAADLGSDVPFFLRPRAEAVADRATAADEGAAAGECGRSTSMALAAGRGERLTALIAAPKLHFVVIYPPEPLSTPRVFSHCQVPADPQSAAGWTLPLGGKDRREIPPLFNRLSEPAREISGWIEKALRALEGVGLRGATMTGSGSACFALADSARAARRAAALLSARRTGLCFAAVPASLPATIRTMT
ncbi:4-(cytidine 5'-diphospho)-2-C-methyl-D-erythritol kinase [Candidatus Laterigemmans baculatus]|uniref:4-(cytidine 5'-diphospho)-2-C-methyl-D-erythritol kinase n=1 Tax=Candidatus Laterigemmans baculatus TaxID=2770505 RepID=UPI0013D8FFCE|nr:4-(cytidine 5'-diphospho)-2-C-methyl-D-erythritol kinase [Candidatus Laterigemmans baculatus]